MTLLLWAFIFSLNNLSYLLHKAVLTSKELMHMKVLWEFWPAFQMQAVVSIDIREMES
jgi:hypothetical protein